MAVSSYYYAGREERPEIRGGFRFLNLKKRIYENLEKESELILYSLYLCAGVYINYRMVPFVVFNSDTFRAWICLL